MQTDNIFMIINYNDAETTLKLLTNIRMYFCLSEIVIIDNGSQDDSVNILQQETNKKISLLPLEKNFGFSGGINRGLAYVREKYGTANVFISNSDIVIKDETDLQILLDVLNSKKFAIVAPTIQEHDTLNRGWRLPTPFEEIQFNIPYFHKFFKKRIAYSESHYQGEYAEVDVVSGCFFLTNTQQMESVDNFDETVFLYYEENILASKLKKIKAKTVVVNHVTIIHEHSVSINKSIQALKKYSFLKESQYYFNKAYNEATPLQLILLKISSRMTYYILKIYYSLRK